MLRQVAEQLPRQVDSRALARGDEVADAVALVHPATSQLAHVDVLAGDVANHRRAGEEHRRVLGHHHEVGQGG